MPADQVPRNPWHQSWWFAVLVTIAVFSVVAALFLWVVSEVLFAPILPGGGGP